MLLPFLLAQTRPASLDLTILHTNDLHGHILPFAYTEIGRSPGERPSVGGAARRATLVRNLKKTLRNPVMLVDAGDTFTRGPLTNAYEGVADIEAMNAVGYDLAAIGNNEFKAKDAREAGDAAGAQAALLRVVKRARFPWLCANAHQGDGGLLEGVQPFVVREIGGARVGFLGLTAPRSANYPQTKGWMISDPVAAATAWIPKARAQCDVLVAVTHLGTDLDAKLVEGTRGIDAVVGGDSHTFLYTPLTPKNLDGETVPVVQDGEFGVNLGRFDLHVERNVDGRYRITRWHDVLLPIDASIREARDVAAITETYVAPLRKVVGRVPKVGRTPEERTALTGSLFAASLRTATNADLGLCRTDNFYEVVRRPAVSLYDLRAILPFKDDVVTARLTGTQVQAIVAKGKVALDGPPVQPEGTYTVAMIDFEAGDTFKVPASAQTAKGIDVRDAVAAFLRRP